MEELDDGNFIGLDDALKLISETLSIPLGFHSTPLDQCVGFPAGEDIVAVISSPPHPTSIKDGFAVIPSDIDAANPSSPILLRCIGDAYAGAPFGRPMSHGECVRVTAGALLPQGSEAVCASEFCEDAPDGQIVFKNNARPGQNILPAGGDVAQGDLLVPQGTIIAAPHLAAMAASGITTVKVFRRPKVFILAVGTEVVAPGEILPPGHLYASNLTECVGWLRQFNIPVATRIVPDDVSSISEALRKAISDGHEFLLTSGGAWGSLRDLVIATLESLGWRQVFYRVRLGPGKGTAFGVIPPTDTSPAIPVFCLPGGPPSNESAFLQLALPGIMRHAGMKGPVFPMIRACLTKPLHGRGLRWTQSFRCALFSGPTDGVIYALPLGGGPPKRPGGDGEGGGREGRGVGGRRGHRLTEMSQALAIARLPEGVDMLPEGAYISVQLLTPHALIPLGPIVQE